METNREQQVCDRQRDHGGPHVIRLLIGPARQHMNGQPYQVAVQLKGFVPSPEKIDDGRYQGDNGYAQICQPGLLVADRRKAKAVEQSADTDGDENRQDKGAQNAEDLSIQLEKT